MALGTAQSLYPRLPVFLQNAACWYYGRKEARIRFGQEFRSRLAELIGSDFWSAGEIEAYQNERLRSLIGHAYRHVPYYRDLMRELGLTPDDIRSRDDLEKLPVLTKEEVRQNLPRLVADNARRERLVLRHTSGSTGRALDFYSSHEGIAFQWAVWWRLRHRFGVSPDTWHVNFTGKPAVPVSQTRPPYWRWNTPMHQVLVNMHHLTPAKVGPIVEFVNRRRFGFFSGYPSVIHAFAYAARQAGLSLADPPPVIFTGGERMHQFQRADVDAVIGGVVADQYGTSEGCGNASQCPHGRYHEDFEFGIMELLDPEPAGDGRLRGRIVCTGFANPDFPLIRYQTGDMAVWEEPSRDCGCGRSSRGVAAVEGRFEDYVVTPEGGRIMRFDYIFKDAHSVRESQVVQRELGAVTLRIVRRPGYTAQDEANLRQAVRQWVSPTIAVSFEYPEQIEREASGKFRAVRSMLGSRAGSAERAADS